MRLRTDAQALQAVELLAAPGRLGNVVADGDTVIARGNGMSTPGIVSLLVHAGLEIEEVTRPIKSLEDVYFEIVRDEGDPV